MSEVDPPRVPSSLTSPDRARVRALTSLLSLQEAFLQRKLDFVEQSQERMKHLKTNAAKRQHTTAVVERSQALRIKRRLSRGHGTSQTTATFVTSPGAIARRKVSKSPGKEGVRGVATSVTGIGGVASPGATWKGGVAKSPAAAVRKVVDHRTVQSTILGHCSSSVVQSPRVPHEDGSGECMAAGQLELE